MTHDLLDFYLDSAVGMRLDTISHFPHVSARLWAFDVWLNYLSFLLNYNVNELKFVWIPDQDT